jgi:pimeloyl-ACP methyl ester carboxylesterase
VLVIFLVVPVTVLVALAAAQLVCSRIDARKFPAPGDMVNIPAGTMHVRRMGERGPAVVLESGIAASSLNWCRLQPDLAQFTTAYSYDRAGFGWSTTRDSTCTLEKITGDLHSLVQAMNVPRPYILVGHSFGGYITRAYAHRYPDELAGLVLVDPLTPEEWIEPTPEQLWLLRRGIWFARIGGALATFGLVRGPLWLLQRGNREAPRKMLATFGPRATETISRLVRQLMKLPPDVLRVIRALWSQPKFYWTMCRYLESIPSCARELDQARLPHDLPVTVLSGAHQPDVRLREHAQIAAQSRAGKHLIADQSAHWVHLDQPELVREAIRQIALSATEKPMAG